MRNGDIFVFTPVCGADPGIAIAGCRAGARGTLDLEYTRNVADARRALARLAQFTTTSYGAKLNADSAVASALLADTRERLGWVVFAGASGTDEQNEELKRIVGQWRARQVEVFVEVVDSDEMRRALELEIDGVIIKGHEAAGRVGAESTLILVQRWFKQFAPSAGGAPRAWVQGGIGLHSAAACVAAGATGVVLDSQLLLARESNVSDAARAWLEAFDGSQTVVLGDALGESYRFAHQPRSARGTALEQDARGIESRTAETSERRRYWREAVALKLAAAGPNDLPVVGQDAASAARLAKRFGTVGGIVQAIREHAQYNIAAARRLAPLSADAPLAASHKTRYPLLQGPMTRVSDTAAFAQAVAEAGGLPFLALALLRKAEVETLLAETRRLVGDRAWGAGILGFLPPEIRKEQVEAILAARPPFALIAGGRPDQARELESQGIPTYLHVPSPGLLQMFLRDGAKRFIFEGRECGGHVGPRTSFVLWDTMCEVILEHLGANGRGDELHVVFAGGIHDELSGAMVAALAARLAERGVRVGALMGTAYLFTAEAVACGAIVPRFQQEALECSRTVLFETGPGHSIRCVDTPYYQAFRTAKARLQQEGKSAEEITRALEMMNLGRLRVASKGVDRVGDGEGFSKLSEVADDQQYSRGMYMIGQVSGLRNGVTSIAQLHADVCDGATRWIEQLDESTAEVEAAETPCDIAIIGMSCFYPGSTNVTAYWQNILHRVYCVTEVPASHWDWQLYYDPQPRAKDKIVSKWGGFLGDIPFDPFTYGITPASMHSIEPLQLLLLEAVRHALADAGYAQRPFPRERTAAICGIGGGGSPMATAYGFRTCLPLIDRVPGMPVRSAEVMEKCEPILPEWTEDSFPGMLMNVAVGRVANRFNLGGPNYAVDAACASSLAALQGCVRELQAGTSDVAVAMGADTVQTPFAYMAFSQTHALSRQGRCRPFDAAADGIVLSEGIGVVVLKRRADAERDGDRIFAVIKGIGSSSDGRERGLTAPNTAGQTRALERAYRQANVPARRVALVEAHGTGTVVGDRTEAESLGRFLRAEGAAQQSCAVGSVKSLIGHSKCAAGLAGLIKTTMAIHRKVLPPTLVETPNPNAGFDDGPLYLNTESRPWIHGGTQPRCAGVSAFGFGGTNFHVVLEEYTGDYREDSPPALVDWPAELFVWRRPTRQSLLESVQQCQQALSRGARPRMADLADSIWRSNGAQEDVPTLAVVASSFDELRERLPAAIGAIRSQDDSRMDPRGIYFAAQPKGLGGPVAFLFPGQGSQYANMLADVAMAFGEVRATIDRAESVLECKHDRPLGRLIYPPSAFGPEQHEQQREALAATEVAQPAVGAASLAMLRLMQNLGVRPDFCAGHSYGEYVALCAAGCLAEDDLIRLSYVRGELMAGASQHSAGGMVAIEGDAQTVEKTLAGIEGITIANLNSPTQTVVSGSRDALERAVAIAGVHDLRARPLSVSCAFHSPLVAAAADRLASELEKVALAAPAITVFSNTTASPYPTDPAAMRELLSRHLTAPVRFQEEIRAMYEAGARVFVEVGPQGVLTGLVKQILGDDAHLAVPSDLNGRNGLLQLQHTLAQLVVRGVSVHLDRLYKSRVTKRFDLSALEEQTDKVTYSPSTWIVSGVRSRPVGAPEPLLLGQRMGGTMIEKTPVESSAKSAVAPASNGKHTSSSTQVGSRAAHLPPDDVHAPAGENGEAAENGFAGWSAAGNDDATQVMLRYQDLMSKFLDAQRSVMENYLQTLGAAPESLPSEAMPLAAWTQSESRERSERAASAELDSPRNGEAVAETSAAQSVADEASDAAIDGPLNGQTTASVTYEAIASRLVDLVSKRTGYPKEMLELDLDLEADLGIDSIKRVEILGTLAESLDAGGAEMGDRIELEKLTTIRNLRGILEYLQVALFQNGRPKAAADDSQEMTAAQLSRKSAASSASLDRSGPVARQDLDVQRGLVELVDAPLGPLTSMLIPSGAILITDDGRGIARAVADSLAEFGQATALLRMAGGTGAATSANVFQADLTDAASVGELLARVRESVGAIGGLLHLMPLAGKIDGEADARRAFREVKSLYLLARQLEEDLVEAAQRGGGIVLAATGMGGQLAFGDDALPADYSAGHGGVAGFTKCLAQEWAEVLVRAVDFDLALGATEIAERLLAEMSDREGPAEVGHHPTGRITWAPQPAPLQPRANGQPVITSQSTILVTGGARGITAAIALELSRRHQPKLVLVGRSALPSATEAGETAGLTDTAEIKAAIIGRLRSAGGSAAHAAVEAEYQRLLRDREIRANLARIRETGAQVEYHAIDVRDAAALGRLLHDLDQRGGIDGVIHGAGVIEDKLVRDKTPESFDRVFGTKVESAFTLARLLDFRRLKFCVFFASLTSRFGNRGQADYAAANEVLSKLAHELDRRWPARVFSVDWGPWAEVGMVAHLEPHLRRRGLKLITPEEGSRFLANELEFGRKGDREVIIAGGSENLVAPRRRHAEPARA